MSNRLLHGTVVLTQILLLSMAILPPFDALGIELTHLQSSAFGPDPRYVGSPAAATDGDRWVALYAGGGTRGLRSRVITSTGELVGEAAIHAVGEVVSPHAAPAIVWIGDRYVVAFQDSLIPPTVYFAELDRDGRALPGTERPVASGLGSPQLCWNGSRLLLLGADSATYGGLRGFILDPSGVEPARGVTFGDDRAYQVSCTPKQDGFVLAGTWWFGLEVYTLDHEGIVAQATIDSGGPTASDYRPRDAHAVVDGSRIRVTWVGQESKNFLRDYWIQTAVLDHDLNVLNRETATVDHAVAVRQMFLDKGQPKALALAEEIEPGGYATAKIQVWSFDDDGTYLGETTLVDRPRYNRDPILLPAASGYALIWLNDDAWRSLRGLFVPSLTDVTPQEGHILSTCRLSQSTPIIASLGTTGVVAWVEIAADATSIFTAAVDSNGVVSNQRQFGRGPIFDVQLTPGDGQVFLSWQEWGAIAGIPLGADGSPLVAQPWRLSSYDHIADGLAVTWNGDGFFFAYQAGGHIRGARAGPASLDDVAILVESPPPPPNWTSQDGNARIAATSEGMLLSWTATRTSQCVGIPCPQVFTHFTATLARDGSLTGEPTQRRQSTERLVASGEQYAAVTGPHGCIQRFGTSGLPVDTEPLCLAPSGLRITATPQGYATAWTPPGDHSAVVVNEIPLQGTPSQSRVLQLPKPSGATIASVGGRLLFGLTQPVGEEADAREAFITTEEGLETAGPVPQPPAVLDYIRTSQRSALLHWMPAPDSLGTLIETETPDGSYGRSETGETAIISFTDRPYRVRLRSWNQNGVSVPGPWREALIRTRPVRR